MSREQRNHIKAQLGQPAVAAASHRPIEQIRAGFAAFMATMRVPPGIRTSPASLGGRRALLVEPEQHYRPGTILYIHGGSFVMGSPETGILLSEVNHRVANSLQLVAGLVRMQSKTVIDEAAKGALQETETRIQAISEIHKSLYTSGDVTSVALDDHLGVMLDNLGVAMRNDGHTARLISVLDTVVLPTDRSVSLGVVATELVTNAFKYA